MGVGLRVVLVAAAVCVLGGCADSGHLGRASADSGSAPVRTLPGMASTAFEQQLAAGGWTLTYRQVADGRRQGSGDAAHGLVLGVVEDGPRLPGELTAVSCRASGADAKAALGFLQSCVPSDRLDQVHHWLVAHLATPSRGRGRALRAGSRSYHLSVDPQRAVRVLSIEPLPPA